MFNPRIQYHRVNDLVLPQRSFGNSFLNNALKIGGGIMSWRDAKKQQEALEEGLKKQEEWREQAYQDWQRKNGIIPEEIDANEQISNYENARELEDLDEEVVKEVLQEEANNPYRWMWRPYETGLRG
jgi:hypothetical protein